MLVRPPILAGTWYRDGADALAAEVDEYLRRARDAAESRAQPLAVVSPHAGYRYSGATAAHAFASVQRGGFDRVIVLAVSHYHSYRGASMLEVDAYETPLGRIPLVSRAERDRLRQAAGLKVVEEAHTREHSLEIQLPFLQRALGDGWELVPILLRDIDAAELEQLGRALRPWCDERTLVVASSDFTHYGDKFGYLPFPGDTKLFARLAELDGGAVERILARDVAGLLDYQEQTGITMCGIKPVACLLHLLPADVRARALAYDTSGRMTGDLRHSVSYQSVAFSHRFENLPVSSALEEQLLSEARETLRCAASGEARPAIVGDASGGLHPVDVFVTLRVRETGALRGCIGSVDDPRPILEAVRASARAAAAKDRRFAPIEPHEVDGLRVQLSVLTPQRRIRPEDVEVGRHGVVIERGGNRGVFLPQVPLEQGWDCDTYLKELCLKARLSEDAWRDPEATLSSFESISISES